MINNILPQSVRKVIEYLQILPGIGPKTAARLAFYLLHIPQEKLDRLGMSIANLKKETVFCSICLNISDETPCPLCSDPTRDKSLLCVVEQSLDIISFERTEKFKGVYHVLHGALNPLHNIGPDEIRIAELIARVKKGEIQEVILATNTSMEGEATSMFIREELKKIMTDNIDRKTFKITRLAHGLPVGADLEYADEFTLSSSLEGRKDYLNY